MTAVELHNAHGYLEQKVLKVEVYNKLVLVAFKLEFSSATEMVAFLAGKLDGK